LNLRKFAVRSIVAIIFGPLILAAAWLGELFFLAVVLAIVSFGVYEFYRMSTFKDTTPQFAFGLVLAVVLCVMAYAGIMQQLWLVLAVAVVLMLVYELFRNSANPLLNLSVTLGGVIYVALLLSFLLLLRNLPQTYGLRDSFGGHLIIMLFVTIWFCDSAAYILGSKIGKHKLFPRVSPNKTVEGTVAGFVIAVLTAYVYGSLSNLSKTPPCPGIKFDESFTPASRLNKDSVRSLSCPTDPQIAPKTTK